MKSGDKRIKDIFLEIDEAMNLTKSNIPVTMENSKFLKLYNKIKEKYNGK
jgi:hypothetical protein